MRTQKAKILTLTSCLAVLLNLVLASVVFANTALSLSDIIIRGESYTSEDPRVIRADKDGNVLWDKALPFQKMGGHDVVLDRNLTEDTFYLTTVLGENSIGGNRRILKFDGTGNLLWDLPLSPGSHDISANPVDGGVYVADRSLETPGAFRINASGNIVWGPKTWGLTRTSAISTDVITGGAYIASQNDFKVVKIDKDGNVLWEKVLSQQPGKINMNPIDGGVYVGRKKDPAIILRLDRDGNIIWQITNFPSPYTYGRAVSPIDGSLYVSSGWGNYLARIGMDGSVLFKVTRSRI